MNALEFIKRFETKNEPVTGQSFILPNGQFLDLEKEKLRHDTLLNQLINVGYTGKDFYELNRNGFIKIDDGSDINGEFRAFIEMYDKCPTDEQIQALNNWIKVQWETGDLAELDIIIHYQNEKYIKTIPFDKWDEVLIQNFYSLVKYQSLYNCHTDGKVFIKHYGIVGKVTVTLTNGITKLTFPFVHPKRKDLDCICQMLNLTTTPIIEVNSNCFVFGKDILIKQPNERQMKISKGNPHKFIEEQLESQIQIPRYLVTDYNYEPTETYFNPIDAFLKD